MVGARALIMLSKFEPVEREYRCYHARMIAALTVTLLNPFRTSEPAVLRILRVAR